MRRIAVIILMLKAFGGFSQDTVPKKEQPLLYKHFITIDIRWYISSSLGYEYKKELKERTSLILGTSAGTGYSSLLSTQYVHLRYGKKISIESGVQYSSLINFRNRIVTDGYSNRKEFYANVKGYPYKPPYEGFFSLYLGGNFVLKRSIIKPYGVLFYGYMYRVQKSFHPWFGLSYGYAIT